MKTVVIDFTLDIDDGVKRISLRWRRGEERRGENVADFQILF